MVGIRDRILGTFSKALKYNKDTSQWENEEIAWSGKELDYAGVTTTWSTIRTVPSGKKLLVYFLTYNLDTAGAELRVREAGATTKLTLKTDVANKEIPMGAGNAPIFEFAAGDLDVQTSTGTGNISMLVKEVTA